MVKPLQSHSPGKRPFTRWQLALAIPIFLSLSGCEGRLSDLSLPDLIPEDFSLDVSALKALSPLTLSESLQSKSQQALAAEPDWPALEQAILAEQNRVRQNPQSYLPILEAHLASMNGEGNIPNGCGRNCTLLTQEGQAAVEEAIAYLRNQPSVPALSPSGGIAQAAKAHAQDQQGGQIGHDGSDGSSPTDRIERSGVENVGTGENIAYGPTTAQSVIMNLIIDDGVPDRGHRTSLFSPDWTLTGVGCGPHASIRTVCVIDYAIGIEYALNVVNDGTVEVLSLNAHGQDILGGPLAIGESRTVALDPSQGCQADLTIGLGGNYADLDWPGLTLCNGTMTLGADDRFTLKYVK